MRPGQQNKRGRGRNNNNNNQNNNGRKGGNPLSRTYDSSGPDVKIRGTAQHIAEKYAALARDAQSSGDNVMAENYLQHAEHYNRIIATAQAQMQERFQRDERDHGDREHGDRDSYGDRDERDGDLSTAEQPQMRQNANGGHVNGTAQANGSRHGNGNGHDQSDADDARENEAPARDASSERMSQPANGSGPQPVIEGTPAELSIDEDDAAASRRAVPGRRRAAARPRRQPRKADAGGEGEGNAQEGAPGDGESQVATASD